MSSGKNPEKKHIHIPFFSIVIPALNEEKTIGKLLTDLAKQTFWDFDVSVVDGNSDDKTAEIIQGFGRENPNVRLLISEKRNVSVQRNAGAKASTGKYIIFLDADDRIPSYFLEGLHYQLIREKVDVWTCWATPDVKSPKYALQMRTANMLIELSAWIGIPYAMGACIGSSRSVFNKLKGFDEKIQFLEDSDYVRRAVKANYDMKIFRDPSFTFSVRRLKKDGTFAMLVKTSPYHLRAIFGDVNFEEQVDAYPMLGGSYFSGKSSHKQKILDRIFSKQRTAIKNFFEELVSRTNE